MLARDPAKAVINNQNAEMTSRLEALRPHVMRALGCSSLESLHAVLGGKNAKLTDIETRVLTSPDAFYAEWLQGLERYVNSPRFSAARYSLLVKIMCDDAKVEEYVAVFLGAPSWDMPILSRENALSTPGSSCG